MLKKTFFPYCINILGLLVIGYALLLPLFFEEKPLPPPAITESMTDIDKGLEWKALPSGLWINKNGDIGFRTHAQTARDYHVVTHFIVESEETPLKDLIDLETFHALKGTFYKDKNHIYNYYSMSCGGSFYPIKFIDHATFTILGDGCFARDKNGIYTERSLDKVNADRDSFQALKGCLAKDKDAYFVWDNRITEKEAKEYLEALK